MILLFGCGGGGGAESSTVPSDVVAACAHAEMIGCTKMEACEGGWATVVYGSVDACATRLAQECERRATSPGARYGAADIQTCAANQDAQTCNQWIGILTPGCGYLGTKPMNEACRFNSQCASGFCDQYLFYTQRNVCGFCASQPAEGAQCHSSCGGDGSVSCEHAPNGQATCARLGSPGTTCDAIARCSVGLGCVISPGDTVSRCQPAAGNVGDPCDDTVGPQCDYRRRIYCNAQLGSCAQAQNVAPGGPCGTLADGSVGQCRQGTCLGASSITPGTCVAYLPDGSPCTFGTGTISCTPPAICDVGVCRIVGGEVCE